MLRAILVAVPAFKRVEPVNTSGPVIRRMSMSQGIATCPAGTQAMAMLRAPILRAWLKPPCT